jgi:hypothetical protein
MNKKETERIKNVDRILKKMAERMGAVTVGTPLWQLFCDEEVDISFCQIQIKEALGEQIYADNGKQKEKLSA